MTKAEMRSKKAELKAEWETCFEEKIENVLTDEGLEKFWDDSTSIREATEMLTVAALQDAFGILDSGDVDMIMISLDKKTDDITIKVHHNGKANDEVL